jgi:sensor histidine kinase YesM
MNKERLKNLKDTLTNGESDSLGNSYGIYNIRSRINLTYGQGSGIKYYSKTGIGTMAVLRLTRREESNGKLRTS